MATRSNIAIEREDGSVEMIYCHYDGYPEYNGKMLEEHYTDVDKVEKLISLGSISSLREEVEPQSGSAHSFESPDPNVTVAYHRDRGEDLQAPAKFVNINQAVGSSLEQEYLYVFSVKTKKWKHFH